MISPRNYNIPYVVEQTNRGERGYDLYSKLLKENIIFIGTGAGRGNTHAGTGRPQAARHHRFHGRA